MAKTRGTTGGKRKKESEKKEVERLQKKQAQEARSRANHPTAGGRLSTDDPVIQAIPYFPHAATPTAEVDILATWANRLTMPALIENFRRMLDEPTGWKKDQKNALLTEVYNRSIKHALFLEATMVAARDYRDTPEVPKTKKTEAARKMAETIVAYLDENF